MNHPRNKCDCKKVETQGAEQDRDAGASSGHCEAAPVQVLFTGQLPIEAGEGDGKGLHGTQGVVVVHGEGVVCHTPKLHHDVVSCRREGEPGVSPVLPAGLSPPSPRGRVPKELPTQPQPKLGL